MHLRCLAAFEFVECRGELVTSQTVVDQRIDLNCAAGHPGDGLFERVAEGEAAADRPIISKNFDTYSSQEMCRSGPQTPARRVRITTSLAAQTDNDRRRCSQLRTLRLD